MNKLKKIAQNKMETPKWAIGLKFTKFETIKCPDYTEPKNKLKAGDVLILKTGEYILVGHVNKHLGVCDDCTDFNIKDIKSISKLNGF